MNKWINKKIILFSKKDNSIFLKEMVFFANSNVLKNKIIAKDTLLFCHSIAEMLRYDSLKAYSTVNSNQ